jgi:hypothetical protein
MFRPNRLLSSFTPFAPWNGAALISPALRAPAVARAAFLILEPDRPSGSLIEVPAGASRNALGRLGR